MNTRSGTARRLFVAFTVLVSTFALASYLTLAHVNRIHEGLARMISAEGGVRLSLELASAVRDQYAHQAHTIILGNETHLPLYAAAEQRVIALTAQVRTRVQAADERAWVDDIERASRQLDLVFRDRIVPAVLRHEVAEVQAEHAEAQLLVTLIQDRADRLVDRFETAIADYQSQVAALQDAAFRWVVFFVAGAPLLAVLVGAYVVRSVAVPVARLRAGAARLAEGDLDTRIEVDSQDEFGALARQFNAMTASLKDHQEQLVQHEKLAGIGRLAAGVAHEINNPLGVILGYTRLLRRRAEGAVAEDLQVIEDETLRAKHIVDGLLDLSRPLHGEPERVDLRALAEDVLARLADAHVLEGVGVEVQGEGFTQGHPAKLRQVMLNLVRNAAEAAGAGGRVVVRVEAGAEVVRLAVEDSGPGLSAEARARLFEPFFTTKAAGTGLGLAVSQGIVRAHGGELEAEDAPGGGARFVARLPAASPPEPRPRLASTS
jgi:signal transduction histidine kinase